MAKPNIVERLRAGGEALLRSLPPRRAYLKPDPQTGEPVQIDAATGRPVAVPTAADERAVADLAAALVELGAAPAPAAPARAVQPVAAPRSVAAPAARPVVAERPLSAEEEAEVVAIAEQCRGVTADHLVPLRAIVRREGTRGPAVRAYVRANSGPLTPASVANRHGRDLLVQAEALRDKRPGMSLAEAIAETARKNPALYEAHAAAVTLNTGVVASPVKP